MNAAAPPTYNNAAVSIHRGLSHPTGSASSNIAPCEISPRTTAVVNLVYPSYCLLVSVKPTRRFMAWPHRRETPEGLAVKLVSTTVGLFRPLTFYIQDFSLFLIVVVGILFLFLYYKIHRWCSITENNMHRSRKFEQRNLLLFLLLLLFFVL